MVWSSVKSAESSRKAICYCHESCPEVDGITYRPGVYKMPMVRMSEKTDELANVQV